MPTFDIPPTTSTWLVAVLAGEGSPPDIPVLGYRVVPGGVELDTPVGPVFTDEYGILRPDETLDLGPNPVIKLVRA